MLQEIVSIPAPFNMVVLIVLIVVGGSVISEVAKQVRHYFCHRAETELKRDMLDRGMSAVEIEQVIAASSPAALRGRTEILGARGCKTPIRSGNV